MSSVERMHPATERERQMRVQRIIQEKNLLSDTLRETKQARTPNISNTHKLETRKGVTCEDVE
jgi:hypothetical protein